MRDRHTQRGRGFGFVKMQFDNKDKARDNKEKILSYNRSQSGHSINDKKVDVKCADTYVKPMPTGPVMGLTPQVPGLPGQVMDPVINANKPNPYVIVE